MDESKRKIPPTPEARNILRKRMAAFVRAQGFTPPLRLDELRVGVEKFLAESGESVEHSDWLAVILNNEAWRDEFFKTPVEMRVLLLPQCLRNPKTCTAKFDEVGLLCESCGKCRISALQELADSLDMVSIVTDSTSAVERLIEEGSVSAVLGVSCMDSLERSFGRTLKRGVAGIAVPLLHGGCKNTTADFDWVAAAMHEKIPGFVMPTDARIRERVSEIFTSENVKSAFGGQSSDVADEAAKSISSGGNRWRPRLLMSAYCAMSQSSDIPDFVKKAAFAVECFHKASLIHDDIEDNDEFREALPALHTKIGVARAINVGDFLLGAGYGILAECGEISLGLLKSAARFHKILAEGQGEELAKADVNLSVGDCLEIYAKKTGGAFAAALDFSVICAGLEAEFSKPLSGFSRNLGIAYQLYDDLRDILSDENSMIINALKEKADPMEALKNIYEDYRLRSYASLEDVKNPSLKRLLFSMTGRILKDA